MTGCDLGLQSYKLYGFEDRIPKYLYSVCIYIELSENRIYSIFMLLLKLKS